MEKRIVFVLWLDSQVLVGLQAQKPTPEQKSVTGSPQPQHTGPGSEVSSDLNYGSLVSVPAAFPALETICACSYWSLLLYSRYSF